MGKMVGVWGLDGNAGRLVEGGRRVGRLVEVCGGWLGWGDGGGSVDKVVGVWCGSV